ncbi:hypothetical protein ACIOD2_22665 [Amycolatopsis sp. NPDC088138]|uniref:hypothetical protein n=1 Tax=Amycolatopsis sp. NPDC088138 TaxID=3363938 RepID=UPI0037FC79D2
MPWTEPVGDDTWRVRYRRTDGTKGAISGFPNATAAENHSSTMLHEQRTGTWIDPEDSRTTIAEFAPAWFDSLDIDQRTEENYRSFPQLDNTAFTELTNLGIRTWEKKLRASGLAKTTVDSIIKCLSLLLSDAAPEKLSPTGTRRTSPGVRISGSPYLNCVISTGIA